MIHGIDAEESVEGVVVEGEAEADIDRTPHVVREGEGILLPANRPHAVRAIRSFKMMLVMIKE